MIFVHSKTLRLYPRGVHSRTFQLEGMFFDDLTSASRAAMAFGILRYSQHIKDFWLGSLQCKHGVKEGDRAPNGGSQ